MSRVVSVIAVAGFALGLVGLSTGFAAGAQVMGRPAPIEKPVAGEAINVAIAPATQADIKALTARIEKLEKENATLRARFENHSHSLIATQTKDYFARTIQCASFKGSTCVLPQSVKDAQKFPDAIVTDAKEATWNQLVWPLFDSTSKPEE